MKQNWRLIHASQKIPVNVLDDDRGIPIKEKRQHEHSNGAQMTVIVALSHLVIDQKHTHKTTTTKMQCKTVFVSGLV